MSADLDATRSYATFRGRSSRSQFWLYTLILMILSLICVTIDISTGTGNEDTLPLTGLCNLVHLIPSAAILVRRIHDSDHSGFWVPPSFIPIVGLIFALLPRQRARTDSVSHAPGPRSTPLRGFLRPIPGMAQALRCRAAGQRLIGLNNGPTCALRVPSMMPSFRLKAEVMQPAAN